MRGTEILPNDSKPESKENTRLLYNKYMDISHGISPDFSPEPTIQKPIPLSLGKFIRDINTESSDSSQSGYEDQPLEKVSKPPFRLKKINQPLPPENIKPNLVMTPDLTLENLQNPLLHPKNPQNPKIAKNLQNFHSSLKPLKSQKPLKTRRLTKKKLKLKTTLRHPTISPKKARAVCEYWKQRSINKPKEDQEKLKKYEQGIYKNSVLFLKNKMQVEEALGGNDQQLYRKSLYGLFQLGKKFQGKYSQSGSKRAR